ncbi:MAG: choice-of-anchor K domain-containing protein [Verrucomicrobiota bacterium]
MKTNTHITPKTAVVSIQRRLSRLAGVTLIEVLAGVAVLGILVSLGTLAYQGMTQGANSTGLATHVRQLNAAVEVYQASGGRITSTDDMYDILTKLKVAANGSAAEQMTGMRGSMIDARLNPVMQSTDEADESGNARAVWDPVRAKFRIAYSGVAGARKFILDESAVPSSEEMSDLSGRDLTFELASSSNWIWDYDAFSNSSSSGPSEYRQQSLPGLPPFPVGPSGGGRGATLPPAPTDLDPPLFSPPGGEFNYTEFNLDVALSNPNPPGSSTMIYSVNEGSWIDYEEGQTILVAPHDEVRAMSVSTNSGLYTDSDPEEETYNSVFVISGVTDGSFHNAVGSEGMSTGGTGSLFEWGTPYFYGGHTDPSWMLFNGASFHEVNANERFMVGELTYFNGTIFTGSGADSVDLAVELAFNDSDSRDFSFTLDLVNTENTDDPWASADYVHLDNVHSAVSQSLGGTDYQLVLEFGETTEQGFSTIDNFHVFEGGTATGVLYGTLVPILNEL